MFPQFAMVRMGKWPDILNDTSSIKPDWTYAGILDDFAKGMALAKTGNHVQAEMHLTLLRKKITNEELKKKFAPHTSSPYEVSQVAENILLATIRFSQKNYKEAFIAIKLATQAEDSLLYSEPKLWMLPARQYQGAFLLQLNKALEAEKVYRDDLAWNPGNGWSVLGLYQALKAQGKTKELAQLKKKYLHSFSEAEVLPTTSAY